MNDHKWIEEAIHVSLESVKVGGYPCGAVIVKDGEVIAKGMSDGKNRCDATLHAEIDAIRKASEKLQTRSLEDCILYTSMEPCVMCFSAAFWAYLPKVVFAVARYQVSQDYYMGDHNLLELNERNFRRRIELCHHDCCSQQALNVITDWEHVHRTI